MRIRPKTVVLTAPLLLVLLAIPTGIDYARGASFVVRASGAGGFPRTVANWSTERVSEADAVIPTRRGELRARLYRPSDIEGPATLIVPGVHAGGIDEPRLVAFARDIAATGRVVVAAELADLKRYSITPRSTDMIEDAAQWLSSQNGYAPDGRIAMMGISFAGGLSVVAAGRPTIRDRVAEVLSFGGHGDLPRTLQYLCTGIQPDGSRRPPHDYGVAIILLGVADRVVPAEQAAPLRASILAFLNASHIDMWDKPQAQLEFARAKTMADALGEPAKTLMGYVNARDVARLGPILLPHAEAMGSDASLSPARSPAPSAAVYLLHGTDDNVIPAVESTLLAQRLKTQGVEVWQLSTPLITHAEVDRSAAARAVWDLVRFWAHLLDEP